MSDLAHLLSTLDPDPRVRGKQFECISRWYLENAPQYRVTLRRVWLWDEWPGRWGADAGIDLVAEDQAGRLWAIQAKAYAPQYAVTKDDVNTFLSESARAEFSYRLLIATTDRLSPNGRRTIDAQEKPVGVVGLSDLVADELDWPSDPRDLRTCPPPTPAVPRDYQREAIDAVTAGFADAERGQLLMACGTGKTLTAGFIAAELDAQRTLVLLPSLSLLKQTLQVWQAHGRPGVQALPVCSDATVSRTDDTAVEHVSELGLPVTTNPAEIAAFLRRDDGPRVVFSTYQSSPRIAEACTFARVPAFDLVVADEAHRCAGPASSDFATVLDGERIRATRRLFMTATPRFYTGRVVKAAGESDLEVASMDNAAVFGEVFHRLGFSEAISRGLLMDYRVAIVGVDDATYRDYADRAVLVTRDGKTVTDARTLAGQIGLAKAMSRYDLRRVISFHSRVARAREFAAEMPAVIEWMPTQDRPDGVLWSRYASGEMSAGERHVLLQTLRGLEDQRGLLANARCLAEGVDVPTLDGVAFIDPRRSEVDIVQAVGRAIRRADDKTVGTIVIPVFVDSSVDPDEALDDSEFKPVWDVIKALRAHDAELGEEIDLLRRELGRHGGGAPKLPDKIHLDVPVHVGQAFIDAFDTRLVERTSQPWEFWFGLLESYAEEHGDYLISSGHDYKQFALGDWAAIQRRDYQNGTLPSERRDRLGALQGWVWGLEDRRWDEGFRRLEEYVTSKGAVTPPQSYEMPDAFRLGAWVNFQRTRFRQGKLESERIERLERLPGWVWSAADAKWEAMFALLVGYVREHGTARVAHGTVVDGVQLAQWVVNVRSRFDKLSAGRRQRLEALPGWVANTKSAQWDRGLELLRKYIAETGTSAVPRAFTTEEFPLGTWVDSRRTEYRAGKLAADRAALLEALPGWDWNPKANKWDQSLEQLLAYVGEHGHAKVPDGYESIDGSRLGAWARQQRSLYKRGELAPGRIVALESVTGWSWGYHGDRWEKAFETLSAHVAEHGTARVSAKFRTPDGYALGVWVSTQRANYRKGTLSDERVERLEELTGWVWNAAK